MRRKFQKPARRMLRAFAFAAICATAFAVTAKAQSPEKFERVAPAKPQPAPSAAPRSGDPLMNEVIRKAQGREREDGFCARVSWPVTAGRFDGVRKAGSSGGFVPWTEQDSGKLFLCGVWRVSAETVRQGIRVRRATSWACMVPGGSCGAFGPFDLCQNRSGEWVTTTNLSECK
jgi:hypothetical protein